MPFSKKYYYNKLDNNIGIIRTTETISTIPIIKPAIPIHLFFCVSGLNLKIEIPPNIIASIPHGIPAIINPTNDNTKLATPNPLFFCPFLTPPFNIYIIILH